MDTLRGRARSFGRYVCVFCTRLISHTHAHTTHILHSHRPIRTAATRRSRTRRPRRSRRPRPDRPLPLRLAPTTTAVAAAAAALHTPRAHTHTRTHAAQRSHGRVWRPDKHYHLLLHSLRLPAKGLDRRVSSFDTHCVWDLTPSPPSCGEGERGVAERGARGQN